MSRFHFNIFDGYSSLDTEGTLLNSAQDARREAIRLAGACWRKKVKSFLRATSGAWR